ncbi:MAG: RidA family protein [Cytophagales bacterium]
MKIIINTPNAPTPIGPYSQAVLVGNTLYLSGQVCIDPSNGTLVNATIEAEARQVMKNLLAVLTEAGMDFSNVVKTTIFLKNMNDFGAVNNVYGEFFTANFPARETVEVSKLPKEAHVEISCIAMK